MSKYFRQFQDILKDSKRLQIERFYSMYFQTYHGNLKNFKRYQKILKYFKQLKMVSSRNLRNSERI